MLPFIVRGEATYKVIEVIHLQPQCHVEVDSQWTRQSVTHTTRKKCEASRLHIHKMHLLSHIFPRDILYKILLLLIDVTTQWSKRLKVKLLVYVLEVRLRCCGDYFLETLNAAQPMIGEWHLNHQDETFFSIQQPVSYIFYYKSSYIVSFTSKHSNYKLALNSIHIIPFWIEHDLLSGPRL